MHGCQGGGARRVGPPGGNGMALDGNTGRLFHAVELPQLVQVLVPDATDMSYSVVSVGPFGNKPMDVAFMVNTMEISTSATP